MGNTEFFKSGDGVPIVKICGLTDPFQAAGCAELGADAIGLVFYKRSPRYVSTDRAVEICSELPLEVITTGVFVNESYDFIMKRVEACSLRAVQLHGSETPGLVNKLAQAGVAVIKALFAGKKPFFIDTTMFDKASGFLVECGRGILPGGNAEQWDWKLAKQVVTDRAVILAGGLTPENVVKAVEFASPDAVDVSSGVEISHGKKDLNKVKAFIHNVKFEKM